MKITKTIAIVTALALCSGHVQASAIVGATEITQILNNIELVMSYAKQAQEVLNTANMIQNQLQAYQNMIQNTQNLGSLNLSNAANTLLQLRNLVNSANGISYMMSNINSQYAAVHKGYSQYSVNGLTPAGLDQQWQKWETLHKEATVKSLEALKLHEADFATEASTLSTIRSQMQTPTGATQAIQIGNELAMENVSQMQKLRELVMSQTQMMGRYAAIAEEKEEYKAGQDKAKTTGTAVPVGDEASFP